MTPKVDGLSDCFLLSLVCLQPCVLCLYYSCNYCCSASICKLWCEYIYFQWKLPLTSNCSLIQWLFKDVQIYPNVWLNACYFDFVLFSFENIVLFSSKDLYQICWINWQIFLCFLHLFFLKGIRKCMLFHMRLKGFNLFCLLCHRLKLYDVSHLILVLFDLYVIASHVTEIMCLAA